MEGARAVEGLQAPTRQVKIGLPVTTHAVSGKAATGPCNREEWNVGLNATRAD